VTDTAVQIDARKYPLARAIPRILKYLRPHRGKIAANLIFATLAVGLSLLFPRIIQYIIDTVIGGGAHGMLIPACAALATTFLLRELFSALRSSSIASSNKASFMTCAATFTSDCSVSRHSFSIGAHPAI
jgi:ABC-type bacteriocin/lantibiotic exporter with double-glycine peptidase domain